MAIGDTVQAGLGRMDFSAFQTAGAAQARANESFGNALAQVATGYIQGQEKKARTEEMTGYLMNQGVSESDAKAIAKNPFLQKEFQRKQEADIRMDIAKLQAATSRANTGRQLAAKQNQLDEQREKEEKAEFAKNRFTSMLFQEVPTGELNQEGLDAFEKGYVFTGGIPSQVDKFISELKQDPSYLETEMVMDMSGNRFMDQFANEPAPVQERALAFIQANAPKPMTPEQLLDYKIKFNKEKRDQAEEKRKALEFEEENKPMPPQAPIYMEAAIEAIDDSLKFVEEDSIINPTVGFGSETMANIGGTDAANLQAALSTVTSAVGFKRLQDMREASPTGGALGAVSERELSQLNAALGSISQSQSKKQLKKNLERIKKHYQNSVKAINAQRMAYQQGKTFKSEQEALDFINQQSQGPGIDTKQGTYRIPGLSVEAQ